MKASPIAPIAPRGNSSPVSLTGAGRRFDERRSKLALALARNSSTRRHAGSAPTEWLSRRLVGSYRSRYPSGRKGTAPLAAFSPRKQNLVVYLIGGFEERHHQLLERLGPHKTGKGCLYLKRLSDVDLEVLRGLVQRSIDVRRGVDRASTAG